ncbi:hypothetical protein [Nocardioides halotolerans]|jgi:predicted ribosomally synthesized peptide with SipW-like signal peptide|uniref:hypothetical protein n=1 Tax=Nocardioides halotolerans TaxID=433660 RepID=UPI0003FBC9D8|nr:hypothetical protein [Nocardioides halotolerans]
MTCRHRAASRARSGRLWDGVRAVLALGIVLGLAPTGTMASWHGTSEPTPHPSAPAEARP